MGRQNTVPIRADTHPRESDAEPLAITPSHSLPVLSEDLSSLDWSQGEYAAEVTASIRAGTSITVRHRLIDNDTLTRAVEAGHAVFATELRCPRTLHSQRAAAAELSQRVTWDPDQVIWEDSFLVNGLVAAGGPPLRSSALNPTVWPDGETVAVPAGWWLARGDMHRLNPKIRSLLSFHAYASLDSGRMSVEEDTTRPHPHFRVKLALDLFKPLKRDVQMAGLIGAFALMPNSTLARDGILADHPAVEELRDILSDAGVPDWDATDGYDPAWAATTFEQFRPAGARDNKEELGD